MAEGLLAVWSDGKIETGEIVTEWTESFQELTGATRTPLEEMNVSAKQAGLGGVSSQIETDIARLDALDAELAGLLKKRQSRLFTEKDKVRLQGLIDAREAIEVKYNLSPADVDGFDTIRRKLEVEVARAQARGQSGADVSVYENAMVGAAQGMAAVNEQLDAQYDKEFALIQEPVDLYRRMKLSVELCDELGVTIYSFPMKYHPIDDPRWFRNRDFIGKKWSKKYVRAVQAVLTSTHGKIGRGKQFFEAAFGADEAEFHEIMMMPEALIIRRFEHDQAKRVRFDKVAAYADACDTITDEWRKEFFDLTPEQRVIADPIIKKNRFTDKDIAVDDPAVRAVLRFYQIQRPEH